MMCRIRCGNRYITRSTAAGHFAAELHRLGELLEIQRLVAVAQGVFGIGMHFEDQPVGPGGDAGGGHLRHQIRVPGAVAGIDDHRQMRWSCR